MKQFEIKGAGLDHNYCREWTKSQFVDFSSKVERLFQFKDECAHVVVRIGSDEMNVEQAFDAIQALWGEFYAKREQTHKQIKVFTGGTTGLPNNYSTKWVKA